MPARLGYCLFMHSRAFYLFLSRKFSNLGGIAFGKISLPFVFAYSRRLQELAWRSNLLSLYSANLFSILSKKT